MNYVLVEHHLALDAVEELVIAAPMVNNLRFVYHKMILQNVEEKLSKSRHTGIVIIHM